MFKANLAISSLTIAVFICQPAIAFKNGFYSVVAPRQIVAASSKGKKKDSVELKEPSLTCLDVEQTAGMADMTLKCVSPDDIEIPQLWGFKKNFNRQQTREILEKERRKNFLVVWFEKPLMWQGPETRDSTATEFRTLGRSAGYKRVLVVGAHSSGIFVLSDTDESARCNCDKSRDPKAPSVGGLK